VIIIGSGAGGGTLAHRLAPSGKKILLLERGGYLPRELENWESEEVFGRERYVTTERWYDRHGVAFRPHAQYFVGGNTKVYAGVLLRLRERDFEAVQHHGGVSPAWPITYADLEPYYAEAERLYLVHGEAGEDPTEPPRSGPFPFPGVSLTPQELVRYSRHIKLSEVGEDGQRRLKRASVLIVGAGGLGSPAALYLAAAGVGRIGIVDFDTVDLSNLQRQLLHDTDRVGERKTDSASARLSAKLMLVNVLPSPGSALASMMTWLAGPSAALLPRTLATSGRLINRFSPRHLRRDIARKRP